MHEPVQTERTAPSGADVEQGQYLTFLLAGETFAIDISAWRRHCGDNPGYVRTSPAGARGSTLGFTGFRNESVVAVFGLQEQPPAARHEVRC